MLSIAFNARSSPDGAMFEPHAQLGHRRKTPLEAILRNIKGRNRRKMIKDYYVAGNLDSLCSELLNDFTG
jgi:hypothetical protein